MATLCMKAVVATIHEGPGEDWTDCKYGLSRFQFGSDWI